MEIRGLGSAAILFPLVLVFSNSCQFDFSNVPDGAVITCKSTADCPSGFTCVTSGLCVKSEDVQKTPQLDGAMTMDPRLLKVGAVSVLKFDVTKELKKAPTVSVTCQGSQKTMELDATESSGLHYVYRYTATGSELEGKEYEVTFQLEDTIGLVSPVLNAGTLTFDFVAPKAGKVTPEKNFIKRDGTVRAHFAVSKELKADTDPVVKLSTGEAMTKVSGGGADLNYVYEYVLTGADSGRGGTTATVRVESYEDKAGNAGGAVESDVVTFDFTPPELLGEASVTPEYAMEGGTVVVTFQANEELAVDPIVKMNDGTVSLSMSKLVNTTYTYNYLVEGTEVDKATPFSVSLALEDRAGNVNNINVKGKTVTFDFTKPHFTLTKVEPGTVLQGGTAFHITFDVNKTMAEGYPKLVYTNGKDPDFDLTKESQTENTYTFGGTVPQLGKSLFNNISIELKDLPGNSAKDVIAQLTVDNTPPEVTKLDAVPPAGKLGDVISIIITADEPLGNPLPTIVSTPDNGGSPIVFTTKTAVGEWRYIYDSPAITAAITEDDYTLQDFDIYDLSGNKTEKKSPGLKFKVNSVAPKVTVLTLPGTKYSEMPGFNKVIVELSCTQDVLAGLSVNVIGKTDGVLTCTSNGISGGDYLYTCALSDGNPVTTDDPEGVHELRVSARNSAGNMDFASSTVEFDFTKPVLTLSTEPDSALRPVKAGENLIVTVTSSEVLKEKSMDLTASGGLVMPKYVQSGNVYTYTRKTQDDEVLTSDLEAKALDVVGHESDKALGQAVLDGLRPAITSAITLDKSPAYYKKDEKVSVTFSTNKSLNDSLPKVTLDVNGTPLNMTCGVGGMNLNTPSITTYGKKLLKNVIPAQAGIQTIHATGSPSARGRQANLSTTGARQNNIAVSSYAQSTYSYTCTLDNPLAGNEQPENQLIPVTISLKDKAGNTGYGTANVTLDFQKPTVKAHSVNPQNAGIGKTITYVIESDEVLSADPTLHPNPTMVFSDPTRLGNQYTWTHVVKSGESTTDYTMKVDLVDLAGNQNPLLSLTGYKVDTVVPVISNVATDKATYSEKDGFKKVTLTFDLVKDVGTGLVATLNGKTMGCNGYQAKPPAASNHTCTYDIIHGAGNVAGRNTISITATDAGGNTDTKTMDVIFDFTAPVLTAIVVPSDRPAKLGENVVITVTSDKPLDGTGVVLKDSGGNPVTFGTRTVTDNKYTWTRPTLSTDDFDLNYNATATDPVGNAAFPKAVNPRANGKVPTISAVVTNLPVYSKNTNYKTVNYANLSLTFTCPKDVKGSLDPLIRGSLVVKVDTVDISNSCTYSGTTYTCTYDITTYQASGGIKNISVMATDSAGNVSTGSTTVTFDFTAPTANGTTVSPDPARLGVGLVYSVTPSETLDGNPTLVVSNHTTPAKILGFAYDSGKAAFTYTTSGGANEVDGLYDVSITMTDPVGNLGTVSNTTLPAVVKPVNLVVSQPTVSNVTTNRTKFSKVTNYQGTNYAGLSLTFDCPKDVKAGGTLRVKLDTVDMTSSCTYASGKYTCTYDVSTTGLSEGTKFITIYAVDSVGNSASGSASVDFDFTAPTAISTAPSKLFYKIGDSSVDYTVKTSEPMMGGGYPEVKVYYLSSAISGFFTPVSIPQSNIYTFTRSPISSDPSGAYDVFINMVDSVGNQTLVSQGVGFDIENTLPDITANSVSPATAKNGTVVNVLFTVTKDLAYAPTVRLGAVTLNGCVESPAKTYTCTHTAATSEGDGVKQALVDLTDLAGNTKTAAIGSVTYDVTPPSLVSSTILRSPTYTPYNNGDNNFYFNDKDPVTEGTVTATLYVYANEDLSASKTLTVIGPDALQFLEGGSSGNVAVFSYTINKWAPDGTYTFKLTWKDTIGNPSTVDLPVKLVKNSWGDTYRVDMTKVTYKRVPWGRLDPADQDTWIPAYLSVDGAANAIKTPLTVKGVYVYKGSSTNPGQPPSTGPGNLIGSTGTINTDGSFSIPQLTSGDLPVIHLAFADKYGVKGGTGLVQNIEWTASIGDKSPGSTFENPNILQTCGRPIPYLASDDSTCYEPTQTEIGNFTKSGPAAISRTTEGRWSQPPRYSTAPDSRSGAAMAYDSARGRVVLFGGKNLSADALNDTWEWDGYDWQKMSPKESPAPRWEPAMAYDSAKGRVVLFGGVSNAGAPEDTWEWDGTNWVKKATTGPTGRYGHAMTYDSARGRVIMLGGNGSYGGDSLTWEWDGSGWTSKWFSGQEQRENPGLAYDSARGKVVLFGGVRWGTSVFLQDTWEYDGTNWVQRAGPACTGTDCYVCGASDCPSAREYPSAAYDSGRGKTVIFGGRDNYDTSFNDTWEWNGSVWTKTSADGPEKRREHPLAYDVVRGRTVLFGGWGDSTPLLNDTWEWDGSDWVQKTSTVPIGRARYGLAHDSARGKTVLFGGYNGDTIPRVQNDTWEWGTTDWKQKSSGTPSGREGIRLSYDSARGRLVMFGGNLESGRASDTWEFDGTNWIQRAGSSCTGSECYICSSATCPSGRTNYSASYDSVRGKTVLFGGRPGTGLLNDTWEWDGTVWVQRAGSSCTGTNCYTCGTSDCPGARDSHQTAYDMVRRKTVLFGGESGFLRDTWEWDGTVWVQRAGSSCTGTSCYVCGAATCPKGRHGHAMTFDTDRGTATVFGGFQSGMGYLNDTWEWNGTTWTERTPSAKPGARGDMQISYDSIRGKSLMFGGIVFGVNTPDTWEWDSGGARTPNAIFQASFYSAVLNMSYSIQSISAGFIGGGVGYPGGVTTGGVRLQPWMDYQWALLSDPSAQNTNDQNTPGPLSWTTTDAVAIRKSVFGPQKYISIAVVPVAIGGRGTGQVSLKDAEVTVKYKLCVYAGDCP